MTLLTKKATLRSETIECPSCGHTLEMKFGKLFCMIGECDKNQITNKKAVRR